MKNEQIHATWQMVALSGDLKEGGVAQRRVAGTPVALFRSKGEIGAVVDRCPHRNYPLSDGKVVEGALECPYHGWRFAKDGSCVSVPGCQVAEDQGAKLGAKPVRVIERHGAIFVRLSEDGPDDIECPTVFGDPDHDHFWWAQGVWKGRAFDAIENVLDPFHTNHIHHGFIRHKTRRLPVTLNVNTFGRGIEMVIEQPEPDKGIMSRFLEKDRARSRTRYYPPTMVQARWEGPTSLTLAVTAFFTPVDDDHLRPFACFTTPKGKAPSWLKQAAIRTFLGPVVNQDRVALEKQNDTVRDFGAPRYKQGPGDILGNRVHRLWAGEEIGEGSDTPVSVML